MISIPAETIQNLRKGWVPARVFITPTLRVKKSGLNVHLWVAQRKLPFLMAGAPFLTQHQAILVPVAPDLKMVFGVAKLVRDQGANMVQREADRVAPLAPGDAFIGAGARYRYDNTVLAVIFDESKRTSPDLITRAVRRGAELANQRGCTSLILPDMTENLLAQPNWITQEQRRATAELAALTLVNAIRASRGVVDRFNVWCWDPNNAGFYIRELNRL
jgi:hypothetical protein